MSRMSRVRVRNRVIWSGLGVGLGAGFGSGLGVGLGTSLYIGIIIWGQSLFKSEPCPGAFSEWTRFLKSKMKAR